MVDWPTQYRYAQKLQSWGPDTPLISFLYTYYRTDLQKFILAL